MEEWQHRVIEERNELDERITKLRKALYSGVVGTATVDHVLLEQQLGAMVAYFNVLRIRCALFGEE